ncbi:hypothetical protein [Fonticella tunisiensis]|uniref:Uncharacterized protein n=1 Tax=Fonticella tunisiensis TaxID=1096341 RepID=A0A4R7KWS1_9CLOT|nr:hypothetical protein [Fonticella tunisiensis]TDT63346.1 hypothetical protein EDD71_102106 [Fonticella tunisiensis]
MQSNDEFLDNINKLIISLKLAQRAELISEENNKNIIDKLYVDPLPNEAIFKQVIEDSTVFLIGRKGTGKSTIFARAQEYFRHQDKEISAYIDVKTLYGKSISQDIKLESHNEYIHKLLLLQNFVLQVLSELISELEKNLENKSTIGKMLKKSNYTKTKLRLTELKERIKKPEFTDVSLIVQSSNQLKGIVSVEKANDVNFRMKGNISKTDSSLETAYDGVMGIKNSSSDEEMRQFSSILLRHFSIKDYMESISEELKSLGINKTHIFLDDFSEIDFEAQQVFVNTILAPLNNWSEKFFRFKIGCYPKRIFYGDIDKGKINEINLDYYNIYKVKDLPELEEKAIDFLDRLLLKRFKFYLDEHPSIIFQIDNKDNTWESYKELLFQISMNIPRVLGYILDYCYKSALIYGKKITKALLEEAAQKYYENQVAYYFEKINYLAEAFNENLDRHAQQILMNKIVEKAKELKTKLANEDTQLFKDIPKNKIPTSHFYIKKGYEKFFYSLELNYFVTKYYEQSDRDGVPISIYSINYGLCKANNILFGRPKGDSKYRKYYISRHFDYNEFLEKYLLGQTKFICNKCGAIYDFNEYDILSKIDMLCYKGCKEKGFIEEKYYFENKDLFNNVEKENLLSEIELDILHLLYQNEDLDLHAALIAKELDCSYQLIAKRATLLEEKGLLTKNQVNVDGISRKVYKITDKAKKIYFENSNKNY